MQHPLVRLSIFNIIENTLCLCDGFVEFLLIPGVRLFRVRGLAITDSARRANSARESSWRSLLSATSPTGGTAGGGGCEYRVQPRYQFQLGDATSLAEGRAGDAVIGLFAGCLLRARCGQY